MDMGIGKYKYYFKKPRSEIVKDILKYLLVSGMIYVAASSPYFTIRLLKEIKNWRKYPQKRLSSAFYVLRKQGCIKIENKGGQIYISLTERGKKKAGWLQIDALKIKKPKKWDGKWRLVIFDISQLKKFFREAFRGKLKELGFYPLQKSVWVIPFDCRAEIELLKDFFDLGNKEVRLIIANDIGESEQLKKIFKLS
jgi:DNA-binding transcriptional regulator PaaX